MRLYPSGFRDCVFAIARIGTALVVIVSGLLFFSQERLIFFGTKLPSDYQFRGEEKFLTVEGNKIHSLLFTVPDSKQMLIYFHGNAGDLSSWEEIAAELSERVRRSVWIVDYPGFGKSEGEISSEAQLHSVATAFLNAAELQMGSRGSLVVFGRSIGSGVAAKLAAENDVAALILESPFYNLELMAGLRFPWAPLYLLKYKFRSDQWMPNVRCPVLVLHGDRDEVIPFEQGQRLAELARTATFVELRNGRHNDLARIPEYWSALNQFLASTLERSNQNGDP